MMLSKIMKIMNRRPQDKGLEGVPVKMPAHIDLSLMQQSTFSQPSFEQIRINDQFGEENLNVSSINHFPIPESHPDFESTQNNPTQNSNIPLVRSAINPKEEDFESNLNEEARRIVELNGGGTANDYADLYAENIDSANMFEQLDHGSSLASSRVRQKMP